MDTDNNYFPEFAYTATQLSAFSLTIDTFVISLRDGRIVHFSPKDITGFKTWLNKHKVRDIHLEENISK